MPGGSNKFKDLANVLIVGLNHHNVNETIDLSRHQDSIKLIPEPENPYDSNAIAAKLNGTTVGHVSRLHTARVHEILKKDGYMHNMFLRYVDYNNSCAEILVGLIWLTEARI